MPAISVDELLESGIHFGHSTSHWNPRMKPYIFGKKNGIYIINLRETVRGILRAYHLMKHISESNGLVLFVGTKKQAKNPVREFAEACDMPYVDQKWLGGTLTNLDVIRGRTTRYAEVEKQVVDDSFLSTLSRRDESGLRREHKKLKRNLEGIKNMDRLPDALVVIDTNYERTAIHEANILGIPVIALADTNGDPEGLSIAVPGNDDAIRSISVFLSKIAEAINEGSKHRKAPEALVEEAAAEAKTEEAPAEKAAASAE